MKKEKIKSQLEVFVCNHQRDNKEKEDCATKGSKELTDRLKKWAKENHGKELKVYRSGCLGMCSEGIAMACYPKHKFLLKISPADEEEIKKKLEKYLDDIDS